MEQSPTTAIGALQQEIRELRAQLGHKVEAHELTSIREEVRADVAQLWAAIKDLELVSE